MRPFPQKLIRAEELGRLQTEDVRKEVKYNITVEICRE